MKRIIAMALCAAMMIGTEVNAATVKGTSGVDGAKYSSEPETIENSERMEELYYTELEYMAQAVQAEAGNQGLQGMILVACVIRNRVNSDVFQDSITEVLQAPRQFEVYFNGTINCLPSADAYEAVDWAFAHPDEYTNIYFFTAGAYNPSGTPLFQYKAHYFSGL